MNLFQSTMSLIDMDSGQFVRDGETITGKTQCFATYPVTTPKSLHKIRNGHWAFGQCGDGDIRTDTFTFFL